MNTTPPPKQNKAPRGKGEETKIKQKRLEQNKMYNENRQQKALNSKTIDDPYHKIIFSTQNCQSSNEVQFLF